MKENPISPYVRLSICLICLLVTASAWAAPPADQNFDSASVGSYSKPVIFGDFSFTDDGPDDVKILNNGILSSGADNSLLYVNPSPNYNQVSEVSFYDTDGNDFKLNSFVLGSLSSDLNVQIRGYLDGGGTPVYTQNVTLNWGAATNISFSGWNKLDKVTIVEQDGGNTLDIEIDDIDVESPLTPPELLSVFPLANAISAATTVNVTAGFNAGILNAASDVFSVHGSMTGKLEGTYSVDSYSQLLFDPTNDLKPGEKVEVTLATGVQSVDMVNMATPYVWQFMAKSSSGPAELNTVTQAIGNSNPSRSVVLGDLDHDGDLDLVEACGDGHEIFIHRNDGNGNLICSYTAGDTVGNATDGEIHITLGDVDNDDDLDLVAGYMYQNYVYLNDGSGLFNAGTFPFGPGDDSVMSLELGDINGDGHLDLAVGMMGFAGVEIYQNDGTGHFISKNQHLGQGENDSVSTAFGDIDNDGDLDLVVGNHNQQNRIYLNDGTGYFTQQALFGGTDSFTYELTLGDIDNDGDLDIVETNYNTANQIYRNNGSGQFIADATFGPSSFTSSVALGDLDGDQDLDILLGMENDLHRIYENEGNGTFISASTFGTGSEMATSLALGDLDGDQDLDVVLSDFSGYVGVYYNELLSPEETITLETPNGGETWQAGTSQNIIYSASPTITSVSLQFSTDGGSTWTPIVESTLNTGSYAWLVPDVSSSNCLVRVADAGYGMPFDVSDGIFTIQSNRNYLIFEDYNNLSNGQTLPGWIQGINGGQIYAQSSEYISPPMGAAVNGDWNANRWFTKTQGTIIFEIDMKPKLGSATNNAFWIGDENVIYFVFWKNDADKWWYFDQNAPVPERWVSFANYDGQWHHFKMIYRTFDNTFDLYMDSTLVVQNVQYLDGYDWTAGISRVGIHSGRGGGGTTSYFDNLQVYTEGTPTPSLDLVTPNGGERWQAGTTQNIVYSASPSITSISLQFSTNGGSTWTPIIESTPNTGSYAWLVPDVSSSNCLVRISDAADGMPFDVSDGMFSINQSSTIPVLYITPSNPTVHRTQQIELSVNISDATGTIGYRVALDYDPNQITYVPGSASISGTSCALWYGPYVNDASPSGQLICTAASEGDPLGPGNGTLLKFSMLINGSLEDDTVIPVTFNSSLTSINEDDITVDLQPWNATVFGPNHQPSFTGGANQVVLEDTGVQEVQNWATDISAGIPYEASQTLWFEVETNKPSLFSTGPAIDASGTLRFTTALNANGVADATAILYDDGGTAHGGIDASTPYHFTITATPVNDPPSFTKGNNVGVFEDSGEYVQANWATSISPGPADESVQSVSFIVTTSNDTLFSATPTIDPNGELRFTPAPDEVGDASVTVTLIDNGGTADGGIDTSASQTFFIHIWEVNDPPSFDGYPYYVLLLAEDSPAQEIIGWATNFSAGPPSEATQSLFFMYEYTNEALFSATPIIQIPTGTLQFTLAPDRNGIAHVTATLYDNGGTASGGINYSSPYHFVISATPVNDPPKFTAGPDQVIVEDAAPQEIIGWATGIEAGPDDEAWQELTFLTWTSNDALFSATPSVDATGTLRYTPAPDQNGSATVAIQLIDNGGVEYGGVNESATKEFTITVQPVNDAPILTLGPNQAVLEDASAQTVIGFATGEAGPPDESGQSLIFDVTNTNLALFEALPAIDVSGALTYTPADDAFGNAVVTVILKDNGGTLSGGIDSSSPSNFVISVTPVNDAPDFIPGATVAFVNDSALTEEVIAWATGIKAGPLNEASQALFFMTNSDQPAFFATPPAIDSPTGSLTFTPALDAHGIVNSSAAIYDNGGILYGGINVSATKPFKIIAYPIYLWGDMNDNGTVGSVDASLILQYDVSRITYFPAFPPSEYPEYDQRYYTEYFPVPIEDDPFFTPAGDVNWDQTIATVDASLILQQYALLIDYFPADTNEDNWGPDYTPSGKAAKRSRDRGYIMDRELSTSVIAAPDGKSWVVRFAVDDANGLCGVKLGLRFDPAQVAVVEEDTCLLVNDAMSLMATNASQDGLFILAGALGVPIDGSPTHPTNVVSVRFKWIGSGEPSGSVLVAIDERLTRLNDGAIPLSGNSVKGIDLLNEVHVSGWMIY